ncbi:MFS transporter [Allosediminivita pacifica]|uniref:Putative MFS family arabinose efflux permease n=1 Tax=Allosediminivita pacifica TaxID=1267769 RepID=A0A2T6B5R2_9RHOB|nr:MFS transporter [Allosediminivita pacifica]PTX51394.1 putative MFS family arabinose efflux permease [Allosediminivita pacifica]GGA99486.1 MFS transporter [Allosediminivita pacifica]
MRSLRFFVENAPFLGAGVLLTFLSSFGQTFFISVFAGEIRSTFDLSHGAWGTLYAASTTLAALAMIWSGPLTDRFRTRALGAIVLVALAGSCLTMALNPAVILLPVIIFLLRFCGQGMTGHIAMVSMSRWFVASRGRALATARLGVAAGEAILPLTVVATMAATGWHVPWVLAAIVCLVAIPGLWRLLRLEREPKSHAAEDSSLGMDGRHWRRPEVLRHWLFWVMAPAIMGPSAFMTAFFFQQVEYAAQKGWGHLELVALFPIYTGLSMVSMILTGLAIDRFGAGRLMPLALAPMAVAFALYGSTESLALTMLGLTFMAIGAGAYGTLPPAFWAEYYGTGHLGAIKSLAIALMVFGSALGPGLTGILIDAGVGIETQFLWVAVYFTATSLLIAVGISWARKRLPPGTIG